MTPTPHDALFKAAFSSPERAAEVLRSVLDPELAAQIDWPGLTLRPGSFIDEELQASHTDLLYAARMRGDEIRIYLLLEHQSTLERWMALRLLKYMNRIWDDHVANERGACSLPPVLSVVLYHGDRAWSAVTEFSQLVDLSGAAAALRGFTPNSGSSWSTWRASTRRRCAARRGRRPCAWCCRRSRRRGPPRTSSS